MKTQSSHNFKVIPQSDVTITYRQYVTLNPDSYFYLYKDLPLPLSLTYNLAHYSTSPASLFPLSWGLVVVGEVAVLVAK